MNGYNWSRGPALGCEKRDEIRKRTSLYLVLPDRLVFLSDLPSNGDTSYAGIVVEDGVLSISYYTSPPGRDYFWLLGMVSDSSIEMARIKVEDLERLADEKLHGMKRGRFSNHPYSPTG